MCRLNPELTLAFTGCTLWHTALIAIHRYFVVVHGDAYHRISKRVHSLISLLIVGTGFHHFEHLLSYLFTLLLVRQQYRCHISKRA